MRPRTWMLALLVVAAGAVASADAYTNRRVAKRTQTYNWHAHYSHTSYGQPVAVVVPPTANLQTNWGWGWSSSRVSRLDHQFGRMYPGPGPHGGPFKNTPPWPQDTRQFGVYNVRAPW